MERSASLVPTARVVLGGHPSLAAHLEATLYPAWARVVRTLAFVAFWIGSTVFTMVLTFDPFVSALPFFLSGSLVYRSWKGKYRVAAFQGACPRCATELQVKPGSRISLPHPLVCYQCHRESELVA